MGKDLLPRLVPPPVEKLAELYYPVTDRGLEGYLMVSSSYLEVHINWNQPSEETLNLYRLQSKSYLLLTEEFPDDKKLPQKFKLQLKTPDPDLERNVILEFNGNSLKSRGDMESKINEFAKEARLVDEYLSKLCPKCRGPKE